MVYELVVGLGREQVEWDFFNVMLFLLVSLVGQGVVILWVKYLGRVVFVVWVLFVFYQQGFWVIVFC